MDAVRPGMIVPRIDDDLVPLVRLGLVRAEPIVVEPCGPDLEAEMEATARALAARHSGEAPAAIPGLAPARGLYRAFGIDPTRTRPSSEALLRRTVQGKPLPRICNAVDLGNLLALRFLLSIGLYDAARLRGAVTLRRGRPGESFPGIRKDEVHLEGRPVLADDRGPFGNPTSDSLRTAVTPETRSLFLVIFAPRAYPQADLRAHVEEARAAMARHLNGGGAATTETAGALQPEEARCPSG